MGCCSSREVSSADVAGNSRPNTSPPVRHTTSNPGPLTSQTAINPPLSATTSHPQNPSLLRRFDPTAASASETSSPRTSTNTGRHPRSSQRRLSLTEHYNVPLLRPKAWASTDRTWTRSQLGREREDFFDTRVTGRREVWDGLKHVAECIHEGNLADAQGILDALAITLPTGRLEDGAYDERGVLYKLPEPILSDPTNLATDTDGETVVGNSLHGPDNLQDKIKLDDKSRGATNPLSSYAVTSAPTGVGQLSSSTSEKGKSPLEKDAVTVRVRLSDRGGPDVVVHIGKTQPISVLTRRLKDEATVHKDAKIRLAYLGKILDEKETLEEQGWMEGHVVQGLVVGGFGV